MTLSPWPLAYAAVAADLYVGYQLAGECASGGTSRRRASVVESVDGDESSLAAVQLVVDGVEAYEHLASLLQVFRVVDDRVGG
jgi:hypothetical protein